MSVVLVLSAVADMRSPSPSSLAMMGTSPSGNEPPEPRTTKPPPMPGFADFIFMFILFDQRNVPSLENFRKYGPVIATTDPSDRVVMEKLNPADGGGKLLTQIGSPVESTLNIVMFRSASPEIPIATQPPPIEADEVENGGFTPYILANPGSSSPSTDRIAR